MTDLTRRRFLGAMLAVAAAPMIVRASSVMPVRAVDPYALFSPTFHRETPSFGPIITWRERHGGYSFALGYIEPASSRDQAILRERLRLAAWNALKAARVYPLLIGTG